MSGRISLSIDSPLRDLLIVLRAVPREASRTALKYGRGEATPIWQEELSGRGATRLQQRVLVDSGRVGATGRNIMLRSGQVGRLSSGTPVQLLAKPVELGAHAGSKYTTRSRKGKQYPRRHGTTFGPVTRPGKVFAPAVRDASARVLSVIIQSVARSLYDALEGQK